MPKFVWAFALIAYAAVAFPVVAYVWDSNKLKSIVKARLFFFGMSLASAVFAIVYLVEVVVGNSVYTLLDSPLYFSISRVPITSFLASLAIVGLSILAISFLKHQQDVSTEQEIH